MQQGDAANTGWCLGIIHNMQANLQVCNKDQCRSIQLLKSTKGLVCNFAITKSLPDKLKCAMRNFYKPAQTKMMSLPFIDHRNEECVGYFR